MLSSWATLVRDLFSRRRGRRFDRVVRGRSASRPSTTHQGEHLEDRRLMAFDIVSAFPNAGQFITPTTVLQEAPQQITLRFSPGAKIDPSTLGAISIVRAGGDQVLGNTNDVTMTPQGGVGIVAVDDFPNQNQVVLRFAETLPDDRYRISIDGGLKTLAGGPGAPAQSFRDGGSFSLDFRLDLGAQVVSVVPQPISRTIGGAIQQARNTVEVYFNANDPLLVGSAQNPRNYRLVETNATSGEDVAIQIPVAVAYDDVAGKATLTFAADLGDKLYRLQIGGSDDENGTTATAVTVGTVFQQTPSTTPAYTTNSFLGDGTAGFNDVDLYKVSLTAGATLTVRISPDAALDAAVRIFGSTGNQVAILATSGAGTQATLTHTAGAAGDFFVGISSAGNTAYVPTNGDDAENGTTRGGYRLELSSDALPSGSDDNSSFDKATGLGTLGLAGQAFNAAIDVRPTIPTPAGSLLFPTPPGTVDEPGHREIPLPVETHEMPASSLTNAGAAAVRQYCFPRIYGTDVQGNPLINVITENQKQRAREIFELYSRATGIRFVETLNSGLKVVTGDLRALEPNIPVPNGPAGLGGPGMSIMSSSIDWGQGEYGGLWQGVAMHEIGHSLGLGHSYDIPSIMGAQGSTVQPGDHDLVHLSVLYPANSTDIDVYSFQLDARGTLAAETVVARPGQPVTSLLDSVLTLYRQDPATGRRELVARNDDYFGRDSFIGLDLEATNGSGDPYTYYLAVTSTGNTAFNPEVENSGANGRSDGQYRLRMSFTPAGAGSNTIVDTTGTPLDGDRDGLAGGAFNFWFRGSTDANTVYVDKVASSSGADGSLAKPYNTVAAGLAAAGTGKSIVRIVGNTAATPYLVGTNLNNQPLADGTSFTVPRGVTVMIDAGAVFKFRSQVIDVGSSSPIVSRAGAALQVLGTPGSRVQFTSYHDDSIGGDSDGAGTGATSGQWGGIIFRQDSDSATRRVFLNSVSNATVRYGGGQVLIDGSLQSIAPLHLESSRPTIAFNDVRNSAGAAISADPNSFEESNGRAGPAIRGNVVRDNSVNGLLVRIRTAFGQPIDRLSVAARFASPDITYVIPENLFIAGGVGGYQTFLQRTGSLTAGNAVVSGLSSVSGLTVGMSVSGPGVPDGTTISSINAENNTLTLSAAAELSGSPVTLAFETGARMARASGRLTIDPGVVVKLQGSRIELERGNAQLYAEGTPQKRVIFTSTKDNRFGAGGTFVATGSTGNVPLAGDWGGIIVNDAAAASVDNAVIGYGGGQTSVAGGFATANTLSVDQGTLRLANSRVENNASGIFVIGAQPVIVSNDFRNNAGDLISVDANSLNSREVSDPGRMTGVSGRLAQYDGNRGPLVRGNTVTAGGVTGMVVRGDTITVESVWDDTDIVHVLRNEIVVSNFHTATGLRLMSSPTASLVVKLRGTAAGLTATGYGLDIDDRIGGTVQVIGQPGYPVILTSLADDSVGASIDPIGVTVTDTNGDGSASRPTAGEWRGLRFLPYSNDRNVAVLRESEPAVTGGLDVNPIPGVAQYLGVLAPNEVGGDDNRRLGFEVHGAIAGDDPTDVDVYSFGGYAGSEVWIDIDNTSPALDAMVELLDSSGAVLARSADWQRDGSLTLDTRGIAASLIKDPDLGLDFYSQNPRDPGMRVVLPGVTGDEPLQYFIRVRSQPKVAAGADQEAYEAQLRSSAVKSGATSGSYELRVRLQQRDEKPGSTVRYADIRYPVVGVDVQGLPQRSPLTGTIGEGGRSAFAYSDFTNSSGLRTSGSVDVEGGRLVMTSSGTAGSAAVWSGQTYAVGAGFESRFRFRIGDLVGAGADGLAFVIQNLGTSQLGSAGAGLGYRGISSFLAVEFDTAFNAEPEAGDQAGNDNQIDIRLRTPGSTVLAGTSLARTAVGAIPNLSDGGEHDVVVRYDGTTLSVFLDDMTTPRVSVAVNLGTALNLTQGLAHVGLTAASGSTGSQRQEIISWSFAATQPAASENDTFGNAQYLGNLLTSDQNSISVAGAISSASDVDWYVLDLNYEQIQSIGGVNNGLKTWATVFDIDYADGFRGDLTLSVFDSSGRLIYVGRDSDVADDQPGAGQTNFEDVSRGSAGKLDPFIGPVHLPAGLPGSSVGEAGWVPPVDPNAPAPATTRYYVAVSSNERLPSQLDMTFKSAATNTLVRLEPVNSVERIVEDRIGLQGYHSGEFVTGNDGDDYTYVAPRGGPLFSLPTLETTVAPFTLDDVVTYLSSRDDATGIAADDLAMRPDGRLYTYAGVPNGTNTAGTLGWIDIRTNAVTAVGNDNIPDYPPFNAPTEVTDPVATLTSAKVFDTTTPFQLDAHPAATSTVSLAGVSGTLQYTVVLPGNPIESTGTWTFTSNATGQLTFTPVFGVPATMPLPGSGLSTVNAAGVVTVTWTDNGSGANVSLSGVSMTTVTYTFIPNPPAPNMVTTDSVDALAWGRGADGWELYYSVRDVDFTTGLETGQSRLYRADAVTGDATGDAPFGRRGTVIAEATANRLGLTTGMAFIGNTLYGVDTNGFLFTIDPLTAAATVVRDLGIPNLQALANGPQNVPGRSSPSATLQRGFFADKLFALAADGWLYAIDVNGNRLNVFDNNTESRSLLGDPVPAGGFTGFAFSPIDIPLWRATNNRGGESGHGVTVAPDRTRDGLYDDNNSQPSESQGLTSIYYGLDGSGGRALDGTPGTLLGHLHLGPNGSQWLSDLISNFGSEVANLPVKGAGQVTLPSFTTSNSRAVQVSQAGSLKVGMSVSGPGIPSNTTITEINGQIVTLNRAATATTPEDGPATDLVFTGEGIAIRTNSFSLEGYDYTDKPTLYFNYWIDAGAGSAEVQASIDGGGEWITIASNELPRSPLDTSLNSLPAFPSVSSRIGQQPNQLVQELFQNTGWRQARIDIGEFAGYADIQLRFLFNPIAIGGVSRGMYLDDFIVGFAERGEMVTGATADTSMFTIGTPVSKTTPQQNLQGPYQLEIRRGMDYGVLASETAGAVQIFTTADTDDRLVRGNLHPFAGFNGVTPAQNLRGDENTPRGQGQFIIDGNVITHADQFGIRIDAAARDAAAGASTMGVVKNTPVLNTSRLVPGVVVTNNVIASTQGEAGILFSGDPIGGLAAPVPFGRIVNNTIHGGVPVTAAATLVAASAVVMVPTTSQLWAGMEVTGTGVLAGTRIQSIDSATQVTLTQAVTTAGTGVALTFAFRTVGVQVTDNASPTLLNNVFASLATGIQVDASSSSTVVGFSAFHNTTSAGVAGENAVTLTSDPFVNAARGNFYPVAKAPIIDSAIDVLQDRPAAVAVTQPLGLPVSPIIAPSRDLYGQLRSDDGTQPSRPGLGANVFKDLGAIDRVDFTQPWLTLADPLDQGSQDADPALNTVALRGAAGSGLARFVLQLNDIGIGIDTSTVVKEAFTLLRNGEPLEEGTNYVFRYLQSTNRVVLESPSAFSAGEYEIRATSRAAGAGLDGWLTDLANNKLLNNNDDGTTSFRVLLIDVPSAPAAVTGTPGDRQVALGWMAAVANGEEITDYVVQFKVAGAATWQTFSDGVSTATEVTVTGLENGTAYEFRILAVNLIGTGPASVAAGPFTPATPASAPLNLAAIAGSGSVELEWGAPDSNGGAAITGYRVEYSSDNGGTWQVFNSSATSPTTVTGLTNGVEYVFRVAAVNSVGAGAFTEVVSGTPRGVAASPANVLGAPGNEQVELSWQPPASDGGYAITGYRVEYSSDNGTTWTVFSSSATSPTTVTGLTNGTAYLFRVAAINAAGTGAAGQSVAVTPRTVAGAPTAVTGTPGNGQVTVAWTTPVSNGGAEITGYTVEYSSDNGTTWTLFSSSASSPTTVTGLTNGTAYLFRVAAVNAAGTGAAGQPAATVTPRTVADAPTAVTGTLGNGQVTVSWTAPVFNGGAAITGYRVEYSSNNGTTWTVFSSSSATSPTTVTGLTNGTSYLFRVSAVNAAGTGAAGQSAAVTPRTVADAPTGVTATPGNGQVAVAWTAPVSNGGSAITGYRVEYSSDNGATWELFSSSATSPTTVTGLTNGTAYLIRVSAVNAQGTGAAGQPAAAVTPRTVADAPAAVTGTPGNGQVTVTWTAPANGGAPITGYRVEYSSNGGTTWISAGTSATTSATVAGLRNGTAYVFRVSAVNAAGTGAPGLSDPVVPRTVAGPPTGVVGTAGNGQVTLTWRAPATDGGARITDYVITMSTSPTSGFREVSDGVSTDTRAVITGLINETTYYFRIRARNEAGDSRPVQSAGFTPFEPVAAPTGLTGAVRSGRVILSWQAPATPPRPITDYVIQFKREADAAWSTFRDSVTPAPTATVTGLQNGVAYLFRVAAVNANGIGLFTDGTERFVPIPLPAAPSGVVGSGAAGTISLSWTAPPSSSLAPVTGYVVQYRSGTTWITVPLDLGSDQTSATITTLTNPAGYRFRVAARNAAGIGPWSAASPLIRPF